MVITITKAFHWDPALAMLAITLTLTYIWRSQRSKSKRNIGFVWWHVLLLWDYRRLYICQMIHLMQEIHSSNNLVSQTLFRSQSADFYFYIETQLYWPKFLKSHVVDCMTRSTMLATLTHYVIWSHPHTHTHWHIHPHSHAPTYPPIHAASYSTVGCKKISSYKFSVITVLANVNGAAGLSERLK